LPECDLIASRHGGWRSAPAAIQYRFSLEPVRPLLISLTSLIRRYDPDLLSLGRYLACRHLLEQSEKLASPPAQP
jgi:hypothetical protein